MRVLFTGLLTIAALVVGLVTAFILIFPGLVGRFAQSFRGKAGHRPSGPAPVQGRPMRTRPTDEIIDVVATKVPTEPNER